MGHQHPLQHPKRLWSVLGMRMVLLLLLMLLMVSGSVDQ